MAVVLDYRGIPSERSRYFQSVGDWRAVSQCLFAVCTLAGLTFQLAADIIGTSVAPTWDEVGRLGAIAVIRTFLNFFLERDLAEAQQPATVSQAAIDK